MSVGPAEYEAELEAYLENEKLDRSTAVRKLLSAGLEDWRRERALDAIASGYITVNKAERLGSLSHLERRCVIPERVYEEVVDT